MTNGALAIRFEMAKVFNPSYLILLRQLRRLRIQHVYQLWKCTKLKLGDCVQREQIFKISERLLERFASPATATTSSECAIWSCREMIFPAVKVREEHQKGRMKMIQSIEVSYLMKSVFQ